MDEIIEDFKRRKMQVDFLHMKLVQNRDQGNAIVYTGKGYIRQTEDDMLIFKIYVDEANNTNFTSSLKSSNDVVVGAVYGELAYYTLYGLASDGVCWSAERVLPGCNWLASYDKPVVHGKLKSCIRGEAQKDPRDLTLHFFEEADVPCALKQANFTAQGYAFQVVKGDGSFMVRARSDRALPGHFDTRVEEALRFLLAQSVMKRVRVQGSQLELISGSRRSLRTGLGPPIARGSIAFVDNSWQLFDCYLGYVLREAKGPHWSPCSGYLHNALEASANSIDAWAIGVVVAVEGLAHMLPYSLRKEQKIKLKAFQNFILKQVNENDTYKEFSSRILGLVGGLTCVRAIDKIRWLMEQGGTDSAYVGVWKKLRDGSVHPMTSKNDVVSLNFQTYIDQLHMVSVLLYHIVFYIIGYAGPYTDYGARGFPLKEYFPSSYLITADRKL